MAIKRALVVQSRQGTDDGAGWKAGGAYGRRTGAVRALSVGCQLVAGQTGFVTAARGGGLTGLKAGFQARLAVIGFKRGKTNKW